MELNVLAVGDVVSQSGLQFLSRRLPQLKRQHGVHFTVVNGENAAGIGLLPRHAEEILDAGADVVTLGNHTESQAGPAAPEDPAREAQPMAPVPGAIITTMTPSRSAVRCSCSERSSPVLEIKRTPRFV